MRRKKQWYPIAMRLEGTWEQARAQGRRKEKDGVFVLKI